MGHQHQRLLRDFRVSRRGGSFSLSENVWEWSNSRSNNLIVSNTVSPGHDGCFRGTRIKTASRLLRRRLHMPSQPAPVDSPLPTRQCNRASPTTLSTPSCQWRETKIELGQVIRYCTKTPLMVSFPLNRICLQNHHIFTGDMRGNSSGPPKNTPQCRQHTPNSAGTQPRPSGQMKCIR